MCFPLSRVLFSCCAARLLLARCASRGINRELVLKNFQHASVIERDGNYLVDQRRYDVSSGRIYTERLILFEGQESHMRFFVREFSYHELAAWLWQVGFQHVSGYDWEGHPFSLQSQRMIVVAEK
jgi:hypothetical protein